MNAAALRQNTKMKEKNKDNNLQIIHKLQNIECKDFTKVVLILL